MTRITIVTPARPDARNGNRHTATRWAQMLRASGLQPRIALSWSGEPCAALIALHALGSYPSITAWREARPRAPLVVVLTGTDLYRDLPTSKEARRSLELADRVITLQDAAARELPAPLRRKVRVVYQSSDTRLRHAPPRERFRIAVVGHLREVKDPFRTVRALQLLDDTPLEVVHVGNALDEAHGEAAREWMRREPRYRWLGSLPHARAMEWIARSHVLVVSSRMEGGANVIAEAARIGTPVLASRMSGNLGMLGSRYPGYYATGDEQALAALIRKAMEKKFHARLKAALRERRARFAPSEERKALLGAVGEALRSRPASR
jgi:putative glycosyltransferase (TIGR04348 family)